MSIFIILITIALVFVFMAVAFFKPKTGLYLLLISRPVIDHSNILRTEYIPGLGITTLQFIGLILPVALIGICLLRKVDYSKDAVYFFKYPIANIYLLFLVFCLPGVFFSDNIIGGLGGWLKLTILWTVIIYAMNCIKTREDIEKLFAVILISSFYPLIFFAFDFLTGNQVMLGGRARIVGGYFNQAVISTMLFCLTPAYLYFIFKDENCLNKKALIGFAFIIFCIQATMYRTSLLGVAVMLIVFLFFRKKYFILGLTLFLLVIGLSLSPSGQERFLPLLTSLSNIGELFNPRPTLTDPMLSGRFGVWRQLINAFADAGIINIIFGFGFELPVRGLIVENAHNDFLSIIMRHGVIAVMIFYWFIFHLLKTGLKQIKDIRQQIIVSFIFGLLMISMAHVTFNDLRNLLFLGVYVTMLFKLPGQGGAEVKQYPGSEPSAWQLAVRAGFSGKE